MRIYIREPAGVATDQMRAYAEYRVFAALARFGRVVRSATVSLEQETGANGPSTCLIDVDLGTEPALRCQSTEGHVADAIDRAADRARRALERRMRQAISS
jgi:ribosome-associated translation inhibitor RaiA